MMADQEEVFENVGAGAAQSYPKQCSALRKGDFVLIKGNPCKIVEMSTSKTGKHGHAKVNMTGLDIFSNKKYEDICPSTHNMNVPHVKRIEYEVIDMNVDGQEMFLTLQDDNAETREDLKLTTQCQMIPCTPGKDHILEDNKCLEDVKNFLANMDERALKATMVAAMGKEVIKELKFKGN